MPEFVWRAAGASGKVEHGRLTAASTAAALRQLREQGFTPLGLDDAESPGAAEGAALAGSAASGAAGVPGVRSGEASKPPCSTA